jgi:hypothetical protein
MTKAVLWYCRVADWRGDRRGSSRAASACTPVRPPAPRRSCLDARVHSPRTGFSLCDFWSCCRMQGGAVSRSPAAGRAWMVPPLPCLASHHRRTDAFALGTKTTLNTPATVQHCCQQGLRLNVHTLFIHLS